MLLLLRTLFWGLLAFWAWRRLRRWLSPPAVRRGQEPRPPEQPSHRDGPPLTNQPIEDADYEELP